MDHLTNASVGNGEVRETPELRAIRESISLPRINDVFVPWEEPWLNGMRYAVFKTIRETWLRSTDVDRARAEANWLWSILPNPLEWCLSPEIETVWAAARQQLAAQVGLMLILIEASDERRNRYFAWLQHTVIPPLEDGHPEIWKATLEFLKSYVIQLTETGDGDADAVEPPSRSFLGRFRLRFVPPCFSMNLLPRNSTSRRVFYFRSETQAQLTQLA